MQDQLPNLSRRRFGGLGAPNTPSHPAPPPIARDLSRRRQHIAVARHRSDPPACIATSLTPSLPGIDKTALISTAVQPYRRQVPENASKSDEPVTFINVFEIPREDLEAFKAGWRQLAQIMASAPGFCDAQLHEAISGETRFQLINVAHWGSEQAWRDAAANPEMQAAARQVGNAPTAQRAVQSTGLYRPTVSFGTEG